MGSGRAIADCFFRQQFAGTDEPLAYRPDADGLGKTSSLQLLVFCMCAFFVFALFFVYTRTANKSQYLAIHIWVEKNRLEQYCCIVREKSAWTILL